MTSIGGSPNYANKMKTKAAVDRLRNGKKQLKDILRQRFKTKLYEKRDELVFTKRFSSSDNTNLELQKQLTEIVRKELSDLTTIDRAAGRPALFSEPLTQDEILELENEMLAEDEWFYSEYERFLEDERDLLALYAAQDNEIQVACPICHKANLTENLCCPQCKLSLPPKVTLNQLKCILDKEMEAHSTHCYNGVSFTTITENSTVSLYMTCGMCGSLSMII